MKRFFSLLLIALALSGSALAVGATELGPATSVTPTSDVGMGDILQPASPGALQVTGNGAEQADTTGAASLQVTTDKSAISSYLSDEADGSPNNFEDNQPRTALWIGLGFAVLATLYTLYYLAHRRFLRRHI